MVDRYRNAGAHVTVLAMSQDALTASRQMTAGSLQRVGAYARAMFRLYSVVRTAAPDYVVGNTLRGSVLAGLASTLARRPFVWMARDRLSSDYVSGASRLVFRAVLRLTASGVIANSFATAATLPAHPRTVTLHDPLAREFFEVAPRAAVERRQVGIIGRLAEWKGHRLFLLAFAEVFAGTDRRARIVGESSGSDAISIAELRTYAHELGIAEQVSFSGHVDDVLYEYQQIDLLVHASLIPEPFGQVVAEALASGCLVVAPDSGGPAELIRNGFNGFAYTMGSVDSLVSALRKADDLPLADRDRMVQHARETIEDLDPDQIVDRFLDFITSLRTRATAR
jgi:glycosyltransferase involved in cell wall biosynthesis